MMRFRRTSSPLSPDQADLETRLRGRSAGMPADDLRTRVMSRVAQELSASRQQALRANRFNLRVAAGLAAGFVVAATLSSVAAQTTHFGLYSAMETPAPQQSGVRGIGANALPLAGAFGQAMALSAELKQAWDARSAGKGNELPPWPHSSVGKVKP